MVTASHDARRRLAALAIVVLGAVFVFLPPEQPRRYDNDQYLYAGTVARMKTGDSYYRAASESYRSVGGAVETTRAFRPPTAFLLWRWIPTGLLWPTFVLLVAVATGLLLTEITTVPLAAPVATVYLLTLGRVSVEYLFVELWAVPLVAASLVAVERRRWWGAAALALAATAVRELAGALLVGGLVYALMRRLPWRPWAVAIAGSIALYALHTALLQPYLAERGTEAKLLGTGSVGAMLKMAGFQLPFDYLLGALLWGLSLFGLTRSGRLPLLGFYAMLPALGLLVDRPYWGAMVVPFFIVWACEAVVALRGTRSPAQP